MLIKKDKKHNLIILSHANLNIFNFEYKQMVLYMN